MSVEGFGGGSLCLFALSCLPASLWPCYSALENGSSAISSVVFGLVGVIGGGVGVHRGPPHRKVTPGWGRHQCWNPKPEVGLAGSADPAGLAGLGGNQAHQTNNHQSYGREVVT